MRKLFFGLLCFMPCLSFAAGHQIQLRTRIVASPQQQKEKRKHFGQSVFAGFINDCVGDWFPEDESHPIGYEVGLAVAQEETPQIKTITTLLMLKLHEDASNIFTISKMFAPIAKKAERYFVKKNGLNGLDEDTIKVELTTELINVFEEQEIFDLNTVD